MEFKHANPNGGNAVASNLNHMDSFCFFKIVKIKFENKPHNTSRKTCPLRSTPVRLAVLGNWVVTRGLL
jgi:hypothetical protein